MPTFNMNREIAQIDPWILGKVMGLRLGDYGPMRGNSACLET